jgi:hypothetical protein
MGSLWQRSSPRLFEQKPHAIGPTKDFLHNFLHKQPGSPDRLVRKAISNSARKKPEEGLFSFPDPCPKEIASPGFCLASSFFFSRSGRRLLRQEGPRGKRGLPPGGRELALLSLDLGSKVMAAEKHLTPRERKDLRFREGYPVGNPLWGLPLSFSAGLFFFFFFFRARYPLG